MFRVISTGSTQRHMVPLRYGLQVSVWRSYCSWRLLAIRSCLSITGLTSGFQNTGLCDLLWSLLQLTTVCSLHLKGKLKGRIKAQAMVHAY